MDYGAWIGVLTFILMFGFLMLGIPIFICLFFATFVGSLLVGVTTYTFHQFTSAPYNITSSYTFAVVPLFVLMSVLAANCGIAGSAYNAAHKWLGNLKGGLLMVTIGSAAIFGASCGSSIASAAVFAKTAMPELEKHKYNKALSMGCIAVNGSLASLIPPSVGIIIICILVDASIGKALVAGIIPGILFAVLLMVTIQLIGFFRPETMPKIEMQVSWNERFSSLALVGPILLIILLVIGGMYFGVFAPTVGGAVGSVAVIVIALIKKSGLKAIAGSFFEAVNLNTQLFPLLISGFMFSRFISFSGLATTILDIIVAANFPPMLLLLIIICFYLIIGCVLEFMSMAVITLPIVYPLLTGVGFDPIATIIMLVFLSEIALITPPLGMSVFLIAGVTKVSAEVVFKGVIPFFVTAILMLALLVFFPALSTWLPNLLYTRF